MAVLGQVMQPGSYRYQPGMTVQDYVKKAGGYAQFSEDGRPSSCCRMVLPGRWKIPGCNYDATALPPGSAIVVPRDLAPLDMRQLAAGYHEHRQLVRGDGGIAGGSGEAVTPAVAAAGFSPAVYLPAASYFRP